MTAWYPWARGVARAALALAALQVAVIFYPDPFFAYAYSSGGITIHSDLPIDAAGAEAALASAKARLTASPLMLDDASYHLYVANAAWRRRLFFLWSYNAGGVVHAPLGPRNAFFSGADFATGQLRSPSGRMVPPPRTFAYFGAHELAHLLESKKAPIRFLLQPEWIREGLADYCALGAVENVGTLRHALGERQLEVADWDAYGTYPRYRLLVTFVLRHQGWTLEQLLASDLSEAEATRMMDDWIARQSQAGDPIVRREAS